MLRVLCQIMVAGLSMSYCLQNSVLFSEVEHQPPPHPRPLGGAMREWPPTDMRIPSTYHWITFCNAITNCPIIVRPLTGVMTAGHCGKGVHSDHQLNVGTLVGRQWYHIHGIGICLSLIMLTASTHRPPASPPYKNTTLWQTLTLWNINWLWTMSMETGVNTRGSGERWR